MNPNEMMKILEDNAYIRTSGTPEELRCAEYIMNEVRKFGCEAHLEPFDVEMAEIQEAELTVDGVNYPCKGYLCAGSWDVEAPLYYLRRKLKRVHWDGRNATVTEFLSEGDSVAEYDNWTLTVHTADPLPLPACDVMPVVIGEKVISGQ